MPASLRSDCTPLSHFGSWTTVDSICALTADLATRSRMHMFARHAQTRYGRISIKKTYQFQLWQSTIMHLIADSGLEKSWQCGEWGSTHVQTLLCNDLGEAVHSDVTNQYNYILLMWKLGSADYDRSTCITIHIAAATLHTMGEVNFR